MAIHGEEPRSISADRARRGAQTEAAMLLHWNQLEHYYGPEIRAHRSHFHNPGQSTYGLLCCRLANDHMRLAASRGDHCEERLLQGPLWQQITNAVRDWVSYKTDQDGKAIVTMVLRETRA